MGHQPRGVSRRNVLRGSALGLAVFAVAGGTTTIAVALEGPGFLTDEEMRTLRALVDRIVPGRLEDLEEGAVYARCAEAVNGLLSAFVTDPPRIYAGAPYSDRGGHPTNDFADFLPLDAYEARAWRLRIEGSKGSRELEFNGPVAGFQAVYRQGLAALEKAAAPLDFAALPGAARDLMLTSTKDEAILQLLDVAVPHTYEFFYGAPEYGGNRDLVSWKMTRFDGDVQPRGWTDEQVTEPDRPLQSVLPQLPVGIALTDLTALAPLASSEVLLGMLDRTGGSLRGLQAEIIAILEASRAG